MDDKKEKLELSEKPVIKKRTNSERFRDHFRAIGDYLWGDIVEPAIKDTVARGAKSAVDMALYGESRDDYRRRDDDRRDYSRISSFVTSYSRASSLDERRDRDRYRRDRDRDLEDIVFRNRADAEKLLDYMDDEIAQYGQVYVGDIYTAMDVDSGFTDYTRGWESIRGARIDRERGGFRVVLPTPKVLK